MNITIVAKNPLIVGDGVVDDQIGRKASSYSHQIANDGGFISASITFSDTVVSAEDWIQSGVARHIEVKSPSMAPIFEGIVNSVSITVGGLMTTVGPLFQTANRVSVAYQTVSYNTNPPIGGNPAVTAVANNTDSQSRYGIIQRVLSAGQMPSANAQQVRDTYLSEYAYPETNSQVNTASGGDAVSISLEVVGYYQMLESYVYTYTAASSTRTIRERILDILGADPNSVISTDYSSIAANTVTVGRYNNNQMTAWQALRELNALGDSSYNRHTIGVYERQRVVYQPVPSDSDAIYTTSLRDPARRIFDLAGSVVPYSEVRSGQWLLISDLMIGYSAPTIKADPRYIFIESVDYSTPSSLTITGGKSARLAQVLAQQGLGGI